MLNLWLHICKFQLSSKATSQKKKKKKKKKEKKKTLGNKWNLDICDEIEKGPDKIQSDKEIVRKKR